MSNYIGQLRLYSLIDLLILLLVTKATAYELIGVVFLHVGFLAFLESRHKHEYRKNIPQLIWIIFIIIGLIFYWHPEGLAFIIFSYLYTLKTKSAFAIFSPLFRGFQCFFLIAGIIGYNNKFIWVVLILTILRNLVGDLRDVVKDNKENMKTIPVIVGFNKEIKYIHLIAILTTTFVWFLYTGYSLLLLVPIFLVQIITYQWTPR